MKSNYFYFIVRIVRQVCHFALIQCRSESMPAQTVNVAHWKRFTIHTSMTIMFALGKKNDEANMLGCHWRPPTKKAVCLLSVNDFESYTLSAFKFIACSIFRNNHFAIGIHLIAVHVFGVRQTESARRRVRVSMSMRMCFFQLEAELTPVKSISSNIQYLFLFRLHYSVYQYILSTVTLCIDALWII